VTRAPGRFERVLETSSSSPRQRVDGGAAKGVLGRVVPLHAKERRACSTGERADREPGRVLREPERGARRRHADVPWVGLTLQRLSNPSTFDVRLRARQRQPWPSRRSAERGGGRRYSGRTELDRVHARSIEGVSINGLDPVCTSLGTACDSSSGCPRDDGVSEVRSSRSGGKKRPSAEGELTEAAIRRGPEVSTTLGKRGEVSRDEGCSALKTES